MGNYNIDAKALGERIRELRLKKNKTQAYFADVLYISPSYLSLIEDLHTDKALPHGRYGSPLLQSEIDG